MPSDALFGPSLTSDRMRETVSERAWVQAMLDVEAAIARAEASVGLIPDGAAAEIVAHCRVAEFDVGQIGRDAVESANPVVPLVKALREKVGGEAANHVHRGATSQDVLDTAMMLVASRAIAVMLDDLGGAAAAAASLAERYRSVVMAGRTLLQQASVTTFGLKAAGWLVAIMEARDALFGVRKFHLAVQFGGAVGTLAALSEGTKVARELAEDLNLRRPLVPWHTNRTVVANLGSVVAIATGVAGKIALDLVLLAQTEVDEVRQHRVAGRGASSTMPQKQNPVDAVEILAAVRGVNAQAGILLGSMLQEQERAAGAWQAEWPAVSELFLLAGGASARLASLLGSLQVDEKRMGRNLELTGGLIMAEHLMTMLAERTGILNARKLVDAVVAKAADDHRSFAELVQEDPEIKRHLDAKDLARAFDPSTYLGSSGALIDAALGHYRATKDYAREL